MKSGENIGCGVLSTFPSSFCCESDIMQISLILAQQIAELFLILLIGCMLVKARPLRWRLRCTRCFFCWRGCCAVRCDWM